MKSNDKNHYSVARIRELTLFKILQDSDYVRKKTTFDPAAKCNCVSTINPSLLR